MTLVDVGPLLALAWQRHEAHERMVAWLSGVTASVGVCCVVAMGLLRRLTNPAVLRSDAMSRRQAWHILDEILSDDRSEWLDEPVGLTEGFRRLSAPGDLSPQTVDCRLSCGVRGGLTASLTTLNRKLPARYPDLDVVVI